MCIGCTQAKLPAHVLALWLHINHIYMYTYSVYSVYQQNTKLSETCVHVLTLYKQMLPRWYISYLRYRLIRMIVIILHALVIAKVRVEPTLSGNMGLWMESQVPLIPSSINTHCLLLWNLRHYITCQFGWQWHLEFNYILWARKSYLWSSCYQPPSVFKALIPCQWYGPNSLPLPCNTRNVSQSRVRLE